jgi:capsular exopolysaccharide synthesis family protein
MEQEAPDLAPARQGIPMLAMFWRRKSLVLLGLVVGLILGALYFAKQKPVYQSSAQVLVIKKRQDALPIPGSEASLSYYDDYLATHMKLIKSPVIVRKAAARKEVQGLATLAGGDRTGTILGGLAVGRDKDPSGSVSNIFELSFRGPVAEDCPIIVNAVIDSYRDFLEENYHNVSRNTLKLITNAQDSLQNDKAKKQKEYEEFQINSPIVLRGKDGTNIHQERIGNIETRVSALVVRRAELRARLEAIERALKEKKSRAEVMALIATDKEKAGKDVGHQRLLEEQLLTLKLEKKLLEEDFGKDHPKVRNVTRRIELTEKLLQNESERQKEAFPQKPGAADRVEQYLRVLRNDLHDADISYEALTQVLEKEKAEVNKLARFEKKEKDLQKDIAQIDKFIDSTVTSLRQMNIVRDFGGYDAQTISPPSDGFKVAPNLVRYLGAAGVLGLFLGCGLAFLAEVTDKSFRTVEEVRRRLGLPVVGHIWHLTAAREPATNGTAGAGALDPMLCTYHEPKSVEAEAYRSLRTALYFSTSGEGHQVIQITSPAMGDGKTTLAANLAIAIGQSGKRVLLIDADFRRPRLHRVFGLAGDVGLASVLIGEAVLRSAIRETPVPGLSVLPCGPIPPNPAEVLTSPRFKELLDGIRKEYDFVVIDTPPLLAVTDPCVVAPRVDGLYLTLRLSKNGRPQAERAREILTTLGAKVLGVVINDLPKKAGAAGYGYGEYLYGYSQEYTSTEEDEAVSANGVAVTKTDSDN